MPASHPKGSVKVPADQVSQNPHEQADRETEIVEFSAHRGYLVICDWMNRKSKQKA